jgi:hypothetical protein
VEELITEAEIYDVVYFSAKDLLVWFDHSKQAIFGLVDVEGTDCFTRELRSPRKLSEAGCEKFDVPSSILFADKDLGCLFFPVDRYDFGAFLDVEKNSRECDLVIFRDVGSSGVTQVKMLENSKVAFVRENGVFLLYRIIEKSGFFHRVEDNFCKYSSELIAGFDLSVEMVTPSLDELFISAATIREKNTCSSENLQYYLIASTAEKETMKNSTLVLYSFEIPNNCVAKRDPLYKQKKADIKYIHNLRICEEDEFQAKEKGLIEASPIALINSQFTYLGYPILIAIEKKKSRALRVYTIKKEKLVLINKVSHFFDGNLTTFGGHGPADSFGNLNYQDQIDSSTFSHSSREKGSNKYLKIVKKYKKKVGSWFSVLNTEGVISQMEVFSLRENALLNNYKGKELSFLIDEVIDLGYGEKIFVTFDVDSQQDSQERSCEELSQDMIISRIGLDYLNQCSKESRCLREGSIRAVDPSFNYDYDSCQTCEEDPKGPSEYETLRYDGDQSLNVDSRFSKFGKITYGTHCFSKEEHDEYDSIETNDDGPVEIRDSTIYSEQTSKIENFKSKDYREKFSKNETLGEDSELNMNPYFSPNYTMVRSPGKGEGFFCEVKDPSVESKIGKGSIFINDQGKQATIYESFLSEVEGKENLKGAYLNYDHSFFDSLGKNGLKNSNEVIRISGGEHMGKERMTEKKKRDLDLLRGPQEDTVKKEKNTKEICSYFKSKKSSKVSIRDECSPQLKDSLNSPKKFYNSKEGNYEFQFLEPRFCGETQTTYEDINFFTHNTLEANELIKENQGNFTKHKTSREEDDDQCSSRGKRLVRSYSNPKELISKERELLFESVSKSFQTKTNLYGGKETVKK